MPVASSTQPTTGGRLEMCRALLAHLGPPAHDMTARQMNRRRELEERIAALEAQLDIQLALPVDDDAPLIAVTTDHGVEQIPLALHRPPDLEATG